MSSDSLSLPFASSLIIHLVVLALASVLVRNHLHHQEFQPIELVDLPTSRETVPVKIPDPASVVTKTLTPKPENRKETKLPAKPDFVTTDKVVPTPLALSKDEIAKPPEAQSTSVTRMDGAPTSSTTRIEGGGSEAGAGNLHGNGDVGLAPGSGTAGGGGGTAASGLGRGTGAPGLPSKGLLRTNREAKPIQTVRATYPAMALRAGMESDVTLRIEIDPRGNVTKAEVVKSGGAGFDDEALKAVRQSRFEPAQHDGQYVAAEFTFVYRFRIRR